MRERLQKAVQLVQEALSLVGMQEPGQLRVGKQEVRPSAGVLRTDVGGELTTAARAPRYDGGESVLL